MTRKELRLTLRELLDDKVAGNYLWSDAYLNTLINQSVVEALCRLDSISTRFSKKSVTNNPLIILDNQALYIFRVSANGKKLTRTGFKALDDYDVNWESRTSDYPTHFLTDFDGNSLETNVIRLYPTPNLSIPININAAIVPDLLESDVDEPQLPASYHFGLLNYAVSQAYLVNDSDAFNMDKSVIFEKKFDMQFGERPTNESLELFRKYSNRRSKASFF